jgi:CSLREA domain-containing protein
MLGGVMEPSPAWAATIAVETATDEVTVNGNCSLREAIINMNTGARARADCAESGAYGTADLITVPNLGQYILDDVGAGENDAVTGDLDIKKPMTIQGPSPTSTAFLNGQGLGDRVFHVQPTGVLSLVNIAIVGGNAGTGAAGGGILNEGTVSLTDVSLSGNDAGTGGFSLHSSGAAVSLLRTRVNGGDGPNAGAGITITGGTLTIRDSEVDNSGGSAPTAYGIRVEGGSASIVNSTISRNAGIGNTVNGGGLFAGAGAGTVTLNNVTLANNRQGIERVGGTVQVSNTLLAENSGPNCVGTIVSTGFNLSDDASCTGFTQTGDLPPNTDAKIEEVAGSFGGPLDTHALLFGSPAVDAGNPGTRLDGNGGRCVATDQRGVARPQDGDNTGGARCDIGAFELLTFLVNATDDAVDAAPGNLVCATGVPVRCTLRAAIQEANAIGSAAVLLPASATPYALSRPGLDATAVNGDLDVTRSIAIIGGGAATTIIDGNGSVTNDRVFEVHGSGDLVLQDVTVRNGNAAGAGTAGDGGGIRAEDGVLDLRRSVVTGNRAARNGGGIASDSVFVIDITDSTISENAASAAGGGVSFNGDTNASITSSLIRGNASVNGAGLRIVETRPNIDSVTISGNIASAEGGGILASGDANRETEISFSTIVNNQAATVGGLRVLPPTAANPGAKIRIDNSIVANNTGGDCTSDRITSRGFNLSSSSTCGFTATGDRQNLDPKVGSLADNGGPTQTHALLPGSPAIDAGNPAINSQGGFACDLTDQRGLPRPRDGDGNGEVRCDIGAVEQQTPLVADLSVTMTDTPDPVNAGGAFTVTASVTNNGPLAATGVVVTLDAAIAINAVTSSVPVSCVPAPATSDPTDCTLQGPLASGASVTLTAQMTAPAAGPTTTLPTARITTTARVHATEPDQNGANNDDVEATEVHAACGPRPRFTQSSRPLGNGLLEVVLAAGTSPDQPNNLLSALRFTRLDNARVSLDGQAPRTDPFDVSLTPGRQSVTMTVERVQGNVATTVVYEVVDLCGTWPSFVGGGPGAF